MARKYVIKNACLNCQYGARSCGLRPHPDRYISAGLQSMANESDIDNYNFYDGQTGFGNCRSPYVSSYQLNVKEKTIYLSDFTDNSQQLAAYGGLRPCNPSALIPWQNPQKNVHIGIEGYCAVMEDGWTICNQGLGIISVIDTGQEDEDQAQAMLEKLEELEKCADAYMQANGIKEEYREGLLESVLLWNGYLEEDKPWNYETNATNRAFCAYLENEDPHLFNYFERGLYLQDKSGETIDISYMLGINKALNYRSDEWECVNKTMTEDRGMYNGYLEACRQERGQGSGDILKSFLKECSSPGYNGADRYSAYLNSPVQEQRDMYCAYSFIDPESMTVGEQNRGVLYQMITGRIQSKMDIDKTQSEDIIAARAEQADLVVNAFLDQLEEDCRRGG